MRTSICGKLLLAGVCMGLGLPLCGQEPSLNGQISSGLEVTVLYNSLLTNVVRSDKFWMQGGSIRVDGLFWHGLSAAGDISGLHAQNASSSGVGLDLVAFIAGPNYRWSPAHRRYEFFGEALAGEAFGFNSLFPGTSAAGGSAKSLALEIGGGMSLRPFEAEWLRTQLPNSDTNIQNNVRLATGIAVRFR